MGESKRDLIKDLSDGKYTTVDPISNLISYTYRDIPYALPINASENLRRHIGAAIIKYQEPDLCFEEILENIPKDAFSDSVTISQNELICFMIAKSTDSCVKVINDMKNVLEKQQHVFSLGEWCFLFSMSRLNESFKSAILLNNNGFFVEVIPIIRLIYEQLCWAVFVIDEKDDEKIKKNSITKNIRYLKEKISKEYGRIYDHLSKESHIEPSTIGKYLDSTIPGSVEILGRSGKKAAANVDTIIMIYKIFIEVLMYGVKHFRMEENDHKYYMEFFEAQIELCTVLYKCYKNQSGLKLLELNRI